MKKLLYLFAFILTAFLILYSCSEEEDTTPPPSVVKPTTPEPEPEPEVSQFTLTVTAGEGGTISTEGGTYDEGTEVTITATPAEGYEFVGWEGSDSTEASLTVTLGANTTLNALFEAVVQYTLSVKVKDYAGGVLIIQSEEWYDFELNFNEGSEVNIVAIPEEGYEFVGWEGIDNNSSEITLEVDSNTSIQAIFQRLPFASTSERYSAINETTGYFKESYYFKRYLSLSEGQKFSQTIMKDWDVTQQTYRAGNRKGISYDFNHDGKLDFYFFSEGVVGNNKINGTHCIVSDYYNLDRDDSFSFPPDTVMEIDGTFSDAHHSEINDIDGDGNLEVITWTWENHDNNIYSVQPEKGIIITSFDDDFNLIYEKEVGVAKAFHQTASGDVDNDGDVDLLSFPTIEPVNQTVFQKFPTILLNDGSGNFTEELIFKDPSFVNDYATFYAVTFKLFDLDGDDFLDIIFGVDLGTLNSPPPSDQIDFNDVYILWGDGTGKFSWDDKLVISIKNEINFQQSLLGVGFSDFDKDGDVDVFLSSTRAEETGSFNDSPATNYENYIINLIENKGNRTFEDETVNKIDGYFHLNREHAGDFYDLVFIDKDSDGDFDLVPRDFTISCCLSRGFEWADDLYWENTGGSFVRRIND